MRTPYSIALEVDRFLCLSLSNYEFEVLVEIIIDSPNQEQTAINLMLCGEKAVWHALEVTKKK